MPPAYVSPSVSAAVKTAQPQLAQVKYFEIVGHISYTLTLDDLRLVEKEDPAYYTDSKVEIQSFDSISAADWKTVNGTVFAQEKTNKLLGSGSLKISSGWAQGVLQTAMNAKKNLRGLNVNNTALTFWLWVEDCTVYAPSVTAIRLSNGLKDTGDILDEKFLTIDGAKIVEQLTGNGWNFVAIDLAQDASATGVFTVNDTVYLDIAGLTSANAATVYLDSFCFVDKTVADNLKAPDWFTEMDSEVVILDCEGEEGAYAYGSAVGQFDYGVVREGNTSVSVIGNQIVKSDSADVVPLSVDTNIPFGNAAVTLWFYAEDVSKISTNGTFTIFRLSVFAGEKTRSMRSSCWSRR